MTGWNTVGVMVAEAEVTTVWLACATPDDVAERACIVPEAISGFVPLPATRDTPEAKAPVAVMILSAVPATVARCDTATPVPGALLMALPSSRLLCAASEALTDFTILVAEPSVTGALACKSPVPVSVRSAVPLVVAT